MELQARSADILLQLFPQVLVEGKKGNIETDFTAREDRGSGP
jgi:hypothetical protein